MISTPMTRWRRGCSAALRLDGQLVYIDEHTDVRCAICGCEFAPPCEAITTSIGTSHVECVSYGRSAMRRGR